MGGDPAVAVAVAEPPPLAPSSEPLFDEDVLRAALALKHSHGIGARRAKALLDRYGGPLEAVAASNRWQADGLASPRVADAFAKGGWREQAEREIEAAWGSRSSVACWGDGTYPRRLMEIPDPPLALYWRGRRELLRAPGLALVGARRCSSYGLEIARRFGEELSHFGLTVISGMALGIDRQAHLAGLRGPGGSLAVLGCGADVAYPKNNGDLHRALSARGLIVSELPPGSPPEARHFPARNRIISGLSLGVMVVEAAARSGSLITARLATEQGREVFAPPGPLGMPTFEGCHSLIRQGALLVTSAEDILRILAPLLSVEAIGDGLRSDGHSSAGPQARRAKLDAAPRLGASEGRAYRLSLEDEPPQTAPAARSPETPPGALAVPKVLPPEASPEEAEIWRLLAEGGQTHIDDLARLLDRDVARVSEQLVLMEIKGMVRKWPGMLYDV